MALKYQFRGSGANQTLVQITGFDQRVAADRMLISDRCRNVLGPTRSATRRVFEEDIKEVRVKGKEIALTYKIPLTPKKTLR
jgi:hypothetical protein